MSKNAADEFWSFSIKFYAQPGISECLIDLQDRFGINVNIMLFCCWCGVSGRLPVDELLLREAIAQTGAWQNSVVQRLRSLRREMKAGIDGIPLRDSNPVREEIKRLEIECERIEQMRLAILVHDATEVVDLASIRIALKTYLRLVGVTYKTEIRDSVEQLVLACSYEDK